MSNFSFYSRTLRSEFQISLSPLETRGQDFKFLFLLLKFEIKISNFSFYSRNSRSEFQISLSTLEIRDQNVKFLFLLSNLLFLLSSMPDVCVCFVFGCVLIVRDFMCVRDVMCQWALITALSLLLQLCICMCVFVYTCMCMFCGNVFRHTCVLIVCVHDIKSVSFVDSPRSCASSLAAV